MSDLKKFESGESIYDASFREKLNALVDAINDSSGAGGDVGSEPEFTESRMEYGIPVRLTGYGSSDGFYEFEEVHDNASGGSDWSVKSGGLTHTDLGEARCRGGWASDTENYPILGRVVYLHLSPVTDASGDRVYEFEAPGPILFPVLMTQTGGSAGSSSTTCSFTYTINDVDSNQLATGVNPSTDPHTHNRPEDVEMVAATEGLAYYGTDTNASELRVVWCNEVMDVSGLGGGGGGTTTGLNFYEEEIWVEDTATAGETKLSDIDFGGRLMSIFHNGETDVSPANITDWTESVDTSEHQFRYHGIDHGDTNIAVGGLDYNILLKGSDGKIYLDLFNAPSSGNKHYIRFMIFYTDQKTAADRTIS